MRLPNRLTARPSWRRAPLLLATALLASCAGNGDFDKSQVPVITITPVIALPLVTIAWTPGGAQLVQVYKGTVAGSGTGPNLVWSITGTSTNSIVSGIEYGTNPPPGGTTDVPAQALVLGQAYTVQVSRVDPNGKSGGFTATGPRYVATQTFTIGNITTGT